MEKDQEQLKREVELKVRSEFDLSHYCKETLENFSFRYFDEATSYAEDLKLGAFEIFGAHRNFKELLKLQDKEAREGIMKLIQNVSFKDKPFVEFSIGIFFESGSFNPGERYSVFSNINWGFPSFDEPKKIKKVVVESELQDVLVFRNTLAKKLEEVCKLFT